jgi:hypothetical protein
MTFRYHCVFTTNEELSEYDSVSTKSSLDLLLCVSRHRSMPNTCPQPCPTREICKEEINSSETAWNHSKDGSSDLPVLTHSHSMGGFHAPNST